MKKFKIQKTCVIHDLTLILFVFVNFIILLFKAAECKINNGDCSHICEDSVCKCPNDCWELDMEGSDIKSHFQNRLMREHKDTPMYQSHHYVISDR